jgi:transposase
MERRKFTREFKLEAVKLIQKRGVTVAQAARDLGVHGTVLRRWVQEVAADAQQAFRVSDVTLRGSSQGCPLLRASNEHIQIVRVLRAKRASGCSLHIFPKPRVARAQGIIRLHPPTLCLPPCFQHSRMALLWKMTAHTILAPLHVARFHLSS